VATRDTTDVPAYQVFVSTFTRQASTIYVSASTDVTELHGLLRSISWLLRYSPKQRLH
jgi:hypothetical protein